jgi:hypothetical protein
MVWGWWPKSGLEAVVVALANLTENVLDNGIPIVAGDVREHRLERHLDLAEICHTLLVKVSHSTLRERCPLSSRTTHPACGGVQWREREAGLCAGDRGKSVNHIYD